ncbi:unnamed protein product [Ilex paraguariensis]|uniref:ER membrane protein complex subunit 4 n=1 Tax=Ilex paraguariensis TaxID=185542 RepID=A0ABC8SJM5_9AQUA
MDKGKAVMGVGRRWAVDFSDNSTAPSSRDILDPPGFTRASQDQDDSTLSRQKKDAEANWKAQLNALGLLPTHASDWVSSLPPAQEVEYSGGGFPLL